ncbi:RNA-directed DNA polymerase [Wolbachia endosymbiont of Atemnus politus]|nr:RNA-directed DNA polymerase [Wolbachia endosymbiont of Atemnus politus]
MITETKKKQKGTDESENYIYIYSGVKKEERAKSGVMIFVHKQLRKNIIHYNYWSDRIIEIRLKINRGYLTIIGVYAPEEGRIEDSDEFYKQLQRIKDKINPNDHLLIMGDLNARIGNTPHRPNIGNVGEPTCNRNGNILRDFTLYNNLKIMNSQFKHKDIHRFTWEARGYKSIIDYIISNMKMSEMIIDTRVFRGSEIDSDHHLLIGKIKWTPRWKKTNKLSQNTKSEHYRVSLLEDESIKGLYQKRIEEWMREREEVRSIEEEWTNLKTIIDKAAKESLGMKRSWMRKRGIRNWDDEIKHVIEEKKKAYRNWLNQKTIESKIEYNRKRALAKQACRKKNRESWDHFVTKLERDCTLKRPNTYKILKSLNRETKENADINIIKTDTWLDYYQKLWYDEDEHLTAFHYSSTIQTEHITMEELKDAINQTRTGKSPGEDGIYAELIKYAGTQFYRRLLNFYNLIWNEGICPQDWNRALIIPIHKRGPKSDCNNYRGISLLNTGYKIYAKILNNKLRSITESKLGEEQNGFRKGRSCIDPAFTLKILIEKHREFNIETHIAFIDYIKAFDKVLRGKLWDILKELEIPSNLHKAIVNLYQDNKIAIKNNGKISDWKPINRGVRQGCPLSPLLFNLYIESILKKWKEINTGGFKINRKINLNTLLFADDQIIIGNSETELQRSIFKLTNIIKDYGMEISIEKTKVMAFLGNDPVRSKIVINNRIVEQVNKFKYLGCTLSYEDEIDIEIKLMNYTKITGLINKVFKPNQVQKHTRTRIYNTIAKPTLLYGSETWTQKKER